MTNIEKYKNIFVEVFGIKESVIDKKFGKDSVDAWDSVHQLNLVTLAEEEFNLMLDPEDIIAFTSYENGLEVLRKQGVEI